MTMLLSRRLRLRCRGRKLWKSWLRSLGCVFDAVHKREDSLSEKERFAVVAEKVGCQFLRV